jgi:glycosyltransferase involved in cell wall biosynthesis
LWAQKKARLIPNGVNYNTFRQIDKSEVREKLGLETNVKAILFMANPEDSNKNVKLLMKAMEYVQTENTIVLTPFPVQHNETLLYYNACDVLVFPSLKEGSPNVIKEAIACNTNIIATPSGDIVERTKGMKNVLISEYDAIDLAKKIDYFLKNNINYNAREVARNQIDEDLIADRIINCYKSLLN